MKEKKPIEIILKIQKPMHAAISKFIKQNPCYESVEDFILEATRTHMQNVIPCKTT